MEQLLNALVDSAKQNKKSLGRLKELALDCQQYELGVKLREIEKELFPENDEVKEAKEVASKINLLFRMVDMSVKEDLCWLIYETMKVYNTKGGSDFKLSDAAELVERHKRLFDK